MAKYQVVQRKSLFQRTCVLIRNSLAIGAVAGLGWSCGAVGVGKLDRAAQRATAASPHPSAPQTVPSTVAMCESDSECEATASALHSGDSDSGGSDRARALKVASTVMGGDEYAGTKCPEDSIIYMDMAQGKWGCVAVDDLDASFFKSEHSV